MMIPVVFQVDLVITQGHLMIGHGFMPHRRRVGLGGFVHSRMGLDRGVWFKVSRWVGVGGLATSLAEGDVTLLLCGGGMWLQAWMW